MKLYIGNLPFSITKEDLQKEFSKFGNIEDITIITDKFSGKSKGFGFITFSDDEDGKKAIAEMNEKEFQGRNLKVSEAKPMEERPRRDSNQRFGQRDRNFGNRSRDSSRRSSPRRY